MTGFRAFPKFPNPRSLPRLSVQEFEQRSKTEMQQAPSITPGHRGTTVWYVSEGEDRYFIVQVDVEGHPPTLLKAICTFTPSMGVDAVDGMLMEDAEHLVLNETLGFETRRLDIYGSAPEIDPIPYLASRGVEVQGESDPNSAPKRWWQFWR